MGNKESSTKADIPDIPEKPSSECHISDKSVLVCDSKMIKTENSISDTKEHIGKLATSATISSCAVGIYHSPHENGECPNVSNNNPLPESIQLQTANLVDLNSDLSFKNKLNANCKGDVEKIAIANENKLLEAVSSISLTSNIHPQVIDDHPSLEIKDTLNFSSTNEVFSGASATVIGHAAESNLNMQPNDIIEETSSIVNSTMVTTLAHDLLECPPPQEFQCTLSEDNRMMEALVILNEDRSDELDLPNITINKSRESCLASDYITKSEEISIPLIGEKEPVLDFSECLFKNSPKDVLLDSECSALSVAKNESEIKVEALQKNAEFLEFCDIAQLNRSPLLQSCISADSDAPVFSEDTPERTPEIKVVKKELFPHALDETVKSDAEKNRAQSDENNLTIKQELVSIENTTTPLLSGCEAVRDLLPSHSELVSSCKDCNESQTLVNEFDLASSIENAGNSDPTITSTEKVHTQHTERSPGKELLNKINPLPLPFENIVQDNTSDNAPALLGEDNNEAQQLVPVLDLKPGLDANSENRISIIFTEECIQHIDPPGKCLLNEIKPLSSCKKAVHDLLPSPSIPLQLCEDSNELQLVNTFDIESHLIDTKLVNTKDITDTEEEYIQYVKDPLEKYLLNERNLLTSSCKEPVQDSFPSHSIPALSCKDNDEIQSSINACASKSDLDSSIVNRATAVMISEDKSIQHVKDPLEKCSLNEMEIDPCNILTKKDVTIEFPIAVSAESHFESVSTSDVNLIPKKDFDSILHDIVTPSFSFDDAGTNNSQEFCSTEIFKDSSAFDFLMKNDKSTNICPSQGRPSVISRFDPLVSGTNALENNNIKKLSLQPLIELENSISDDSFQCAEPTCTSQMSKNLTEQEFQNALKLHEMQLQESLIEHEKEQNNHINAVKHSIECLLHQKDSLCTACNIMRNTINEEINFANTECIKKKSELIDATIHRKNLTVERDQALEDLRNVEKAFSDLMVRYNNAKVVLEQMKSNEISLKQKIDISIRDSSERQDKYNTLHLHADEQLNIVNEELLKFQKDNEAEKAAVTAMLRKSEIRVRSLTTTLNQTVKDSHELLRMCEEFGYKQAT